MENEKVCVNLAPAELGKIDVLVAQGLFTSRTDLIREGIRQVLAEHATTVEKVALGAAGIGVLAVTRKQLEEARRDRERLTMKVIGMLVIESDVTPDLADQTIHDIRIFGSVRGPKPVLTRLGNRIKRGFVP
jgi:Arc/MetJ-type ribon-helix-helix transcriptional regulator